MEQLSLESGKVRRGRKKAAQTHSAAKKKATKAATKKEPRGKPAKMNPKAATKQPKPPRKQGLVKVAGAETKKAEVKKAAAAAKVSQKIKNNTVKNNTVGLQLQQARVEQNLSVAEVAKKLRWQESQVLALEADEMALLPKGAYLRAFVQSYAQILDIPFEPLEKALRAQGYSTTTLFAELPKPITTAVLPTKNLVWVASFSLVVLFVLWGVYLGSTKWQPELGVYSFNALSSEENALSLPPEKAPEKAPAVKPSPAAVPETY